MASCEAHGRAVLSRCFLDSASTADIGPAAATKAAQSRATTVTSRTGVASTAAGQVPGPSRSNFGSRSLRDGERVDPGPSQKRHQSGRANSHRLGALTYIVGATKAQAVRVLPVRVIEQNEHQ